MIRKFLEGLCYGAGFTLSLFVVGWLGLYFLSFRSPDMHGIRFSTQSSSPLIEESLSQPQFHELPLEEQIKKASVIALVRYEKTGDGKNRAIINEFLKKDANAVLYYDIGDEYAEGSFYPSDTKDIRDGLIIFFVGSPATMRMSMSFSGDRIRSLGDIPLELLRMKCKAIS